MEHTNARPTVECEGEQPSELRKRFQQLSAQLGRPPRILLAEDDDDVRWCLSSMFEIDGFHVVSVGNGVEFVEEISSALLDKKDIDAPDVIVTDVRMPGFYIFNIIEELRASGWEVPVLVVSGFDDAHTREKAADVGARFFTKPVDFTNLEDAVLSAIEQKTSSRVQ